MEAMKRADHIIDFGPDSFGGEVIAEGTPHMLKKNERSRIGKYIL